MLLAPTGKRAKAEYIRQRVKLVTGLSQEDALQVKVPTSNKGARTLYKLNDLKYDIAGGYLQVGKKKVGRDKVGKTNALENPKAPARKKGASKTNEQRGNKVAAKSRPSLPAAKDKSKTESAPKAKKQEKKSEQHASGDTSLHNDLCSRCGIGGDVLCCDFCTLVYHMACVTPPLRSLPKGKWGCPVCKKEALAADKQLKLAGKKTFTGDEAWVKDETPCKEVRAGMKITYCFQQGTFVGTVASLDAKNNLKRIWYHVEFEDGDKQKVMLTEGRKRRCDQTAPLVEGQWCTGVVKRPTLPPKMTALKAQTKGRGQKNVPEKSKRKRMASGAAAECRHLAGNAPAKRIKTHTKEKTPAVNPPGHSGRSETAYRLEGSAQSQHKCAEMPFRIYGNEVRKRPQGHCGWAGCGKDKHVTLQVCCTGCVNRKFNPQGFCSAEHWARHHGFSSTQWATAGVVPASIVVSGTSTMVSDADEDAAADVPEGWRTGGHEWVGRRARRVWELKDDASGVVLSEHNHDGNITRWIPADEEAGDQALWHMVHDDGDEEDLDEVEALGAVSQWDQHLSRSYKFQLDPLRKELEQFLEIVRRHIPGHGCASPSESGIAGVLHAKLSEAVRAERNSTRESLRRQQESKTKQSYDTEDLWASAEYREGMSPSKSRVGAKRLRTAGCGAGSPTRQRPSRERRGTSSTIKGSSPLVKDGPPSVSSPHRGISGDGGGGKYGAYHVLVIRARIKQKDSNANCGEGAGETEGGGGETRKKTKKLGKRWGGKKLGKSKGQEKTRWGPVVGGALFWESVGGRGRGRSCFGGRSQGPGMALLLFAVHSDWQGKGYGRLLLHQLMLMRSPTSTTTRVVTSATSVAAERTVQVKTHQRLVLDGAANGHTNGHGYSLPAGTAGTAGKSNKKGAPAAACAALYMQGQKLRDIAVHADVNAVLFFAKHGFNRVEDEGQGKGSSKIGSKKGGGKHKQAGRKRPRPYGYLLEELDKHEETDAELMVWQAGKAGLGVTYHEMRDWPAREEWEYTPSWHLPRAANAMTGGADGGHDRKPPARSSAAAAAAALAKISVTVPKATDGGGDATAKPDAELSDKIVYGERNLASEAAEWVSKKGNKENTKEDAKKLGEGSDDDEDDEDDSKHDFEVGAIVNHTWDRAWVEIAFRGFGPSWNEAQRVEDLDNCAEMVAAYFRKQDSL
jgi:GNAT superfamily N-acetyltransferase